MKKSLRNIYKSIPLKYRDYFHYCIHKINNNLILLKMLHVREKRTFKRMDNQRASHILRIGESQYFSGSISTNYQVFAKNFLDVTRSINVLRKFRYVIADNVIEHLTLSQARLMLRNIYEVLDEAGTVRISTPDIEEIVKKYTSASKQDLQDFAEEMSPHGLQILYPVDLLHGTFSAFGHHKGFLWDFDTLKIELEAAGFIQVRKFKPGSSDIPELKNLEKRLNGCNTWAQMSIEANK